MSCIVLVHTSLVTKAVLVKRQDAWCGSRRRHLVKMAAEHSWQAYVQHAWGMDELMPLTKRGKNTFGGMGATIIDSLDTLWLLDMKDAFKAARDWVAESLVFDRSGRCYFTASCRRQC